MKADQSRLVLFVGESVQTSCNTSNQLKHLKSKHKKEYSLVHEEKLPVKQAHLATLEMTLEQSKLYGKESAHHKQINEALVKMLAVNFQPASIVEDKVFLNFLQIVDPKYVPATKSSYHHEKYSSR